MVHSEHDHPEDGNHENRARGLSGFRTPSHGQGQNPDRGQPGRCPDLVTGVIKGSEQNGGEVQREDEEHGRNCIARRGDDRLDYEHRGDPAEHR